MGLDIYAVFQRFENSAWIDVESHYDRQRDYDLFQWLAWGSPYKMDTCHFAPIAPLRGLPDDFQMIDGAFHPSPLAKIEKYQTHPGCIFLGGHGHSWLLGSEILSAIVPRVIRTVSTPRDEYESWDDDQCRPWQWATANFGHPVGEPDSIEMLESEVLAKWSYDFTADFAYFIEEVRRLVALHGNVRFVFGIS